MGVSPNGVKVSLRGPIKRGDGVVFDCGRPEDREEGGSVYEVLDGRGRSVGAPGEKPLMSGMVTLTFGKGAVDLRRIRSGDLVWRNRDAALDKRLEALVNNGAGGTNERVGVHVSVSASEGQPMQIQVRDQQGRVGAAQTASTVQPARNKQVEGNDSHLACTCKSITCMYVS